MLDLCWAGDPVVAACPPDWLSCPSLLPSVHLLSVNCIQIRLWSPMKEFIFLKMFIEVCRLYRKSIASSMLNNHFYQIFHKQGNMDRLNLFITPLIKWSFLKTIFSINEQICNWDPLRDLVPFLQFKKREKLPGHGGELILVKLRLIAISLAIIYCIHVSIPGGHESSLFITIAG